MKHLSQTFLFLLLLTAAIPVQGQDRYWVFFEDKGPETTFWAQNPEKIFAPEALERKKKRGIEITESDYPVSKTYLTQLREAGIPLHRTSRWLNAVSIDASVDFEALRAICPAIRASKPVSQWAQVTSATEPETDPETDSLPTTEKVNTVPDYGNAATQNEMIGVDALHANGNQGAGIRIAIFDAGFYAVDTMGFFDSLWTQNRVASYWDFVDSDTLIFTENSHGMAVLSVMAANEPGVLVGTAPQATYYFARTEDVASETHAEEDNWVSAMEWADSIGIDLIQSSLGYNIFDPGEGDFTYDTLDGNTTVITRAADRAAERGMLVVTSAGNEGNGSWHYITAPCDADSVLCVGSVDAFEIKSGFSSWGPRTDNVIKPDVMGMGGQTAVAGIFGQATNGNGTSFASPAVAGLAACLWQAHPNRNNFEVIEAIRQSADRYQMPDSGYGYGIPNGAIADSILNVMDSLALGTDQSWTDQINLYPNPTTEILQVEIPVGFQLETAEIISLTGARVVAPQPLNPFGKTAIEVGQLSSGVYFLRIPRQGHPPALLRFRKL